MTRYAVAFDMVTTSLSDERKSGIYAEIQRLLTRAGFSEHLQGSVYLTPQVNDQITEIEMRLILELAGQAIIPNCKEMHLFRVEEHRDVMADLLNAGKHLVKG